jgi:hypothetical protein
MEEVEKQYNEMMMLCRRAISQAQDIVLSAKEFKLPRELHE